MTRTPGLQGKSSYHPHYVCGLEVVPRPSHSFRTSPRTLTLAHLLARGSFGTDEWLGGALVVAVDEVPTSR